MTHAPIRRPAAAPKDATVTATAPGVDDLAVLLPDWRTHLRARNVAPSTIASYLKVGDNLLVWLREAGVAEGGRRLPPGDPAGLLAAHPHPGSPRPGRSEENTPGHQTRHTLLFPLLPSKKKNLPV